MVERIPWEGSPPKKRTARPPPGISRAVQPVYPKFVKYWLLKTEPSAYSWDDLVRDKKTFWDGVRNYQARNNMAAMKKGDQALIYHSVGPKEVVGTATITAESYPDPTTEDERWVVVDVKAGKALPKPVTLAEIKATEVLAEIALVKQSRLSVVPLSAKEFNKILKMAGVR